MKLTRFCHKIQRMAQQQSNEIRAIIAASLNFRMEIHSGNITNSILIVKLNYEKERYLNTHCNEIVTKTVFF